jgi:hypothetical protein
MDSIILETEAMALAPIERARLADKLLSSLSLPSDDGITNSWISLAEKRLTDFDKGNSKALAGREVLSD